MSIVCFFPCLILGTSTFCSKKEFNPSAKPLASYSHRWDDGGNYTIKARAKDIYGAVGNWSTYPVTMPRSKASNPQYAIFLRLFNLFPNVFPILRNLLRH